MDSIHSGRRGEGSWHRDNGGLLEACADNRLGYEEIEDGHKHRCQVIRAGLEYTSRMTSSPAAFWKALLSLLQSVMVLSPCFMPLTGALSLYRLFASFTLSAGRKMLSCTPFHFPKASPELYAAVSLCFQIVEGFNCDCRHSLQMNPRATSVDMLDVFRDGPEHVPVYVTQCILQRGFDLLSPGLCV